MLSTGSTEINRKRITVRLQSFFLALLVVGIATDAAFADDPVNFEHKLSPGILTAHGDWTVSLNYDLGLSTELWSQPKGDSFRKSLSAHIATKGALAVDPDLNTTPLNSDAGFSTSINLYRPSKVIPGQNPGEYKTEEKGFNFGRLSFSLLAGYETDQRLDNRNITSGVELGYSMTENQGFKALIPSIFIGYDLVFVDHSKLQATLGVDDDNSRRLRVFGSWKLPVGQWLPGPLEPLNGHFDIRYYLSDGAPIAVRAADRDDAIYVAGALSYSFSQEPLWGFVNSVYARVTNGRIPPATDDSTTFTVGLTVWEK